MSGIIHRPIFITWLKSKNGFTLTGQNTSAILILSMFPLLPYLIPTIYSNELRNSIRERYRQGRQ